VRLEVIDTGVGIAAEHISDICDEFYQVGIEAQQSREGYGLGLSIVRRLANLLHTKLDIRSTLGAGSTFSVRLPRVRRRRTAPPYSPTPEPAPITDTALGTGQRILLVEDDASVRDATRLLLKISGYAVTAVTNATEALDHATRDDEDAGAAGREEGDGCSRLRHITGRTFRDVNIFCISSGYGIETDVHAWCVDEVRGENGEKSSTN
jgi:CheY-like chemotaxis protein